MGDSKILGKRMKLLRGNKTQEEMSKLLGLSRASYSHYENNRVEPDTEMLRKIADVHNVTIDYLLGRTSYPSNNAANGSKEFYMSKIATEFPNIDLMFKDMESLTAEEMQDVYEYIKFKMSQKKGDD